MQARKMAARHTVPLSSLGRFSTRTAILSHTELARLNQMAARGSPRRTQAELVPSGVGSYTMAKIYLPPQNFIRRAVGAPILLQPVGSFMYYCMYRPYTLTASMHACMR